MAARILLLSLLAANLLHSALCLHPTRARSKCLRSCPPSPCRQLVLSGESKYTCPQGYMKDRCGCELPECQCVGCPRLNTNLKCNIGYEMDSRRCPKSECLVPCMKCSELASAYSTPGITPFTCPNGWVEDECCGEGCCQCEKCPRFDNTKQCENGYRTRSRCPVSICSTRVRPPHFQQLNDPIVAASPPSRSTTTQPSPAGHPPRTIIKANRLFRCPREKEWLPSDDETGLCSSHEHCSRRTMCCASPTNSQLHCVNFVFSST